MAGKCSCTYLRVRNSFNIFQRIKIAIFPNCWQAKSRLHPYLTYFRPMVERKRAEKASKQREKESLIGLTLNEKVIDFLILLNINRSLPQEGFSFLII